MKNAKKSTRRTKKASPKKTRKATGDVNLNKQKKFAKRVMSKLEKRIVKFEKRAKTLKMSALLVNSLGMIRKYVRTQLKGY